MVSPEKVSVMKPENLKSAAVPAARTSRAMWAGSYVEPWLYRVCIRARGRPAECSDDANAHP